MLRARLHRTPDSILSLEAAWKSLPCPTPFCSWEFAQHWLQTHAADTEPFVISVRDESERIVAIAPWSLVRRRHRFGNRMITGIGEGDGWYHDPLLSRSDPALAEALIDGLKGAHANWDSLQLKLRPAFSTPLVSRLQRLGQLVERHDDALNNRIIDLSGSWDSYHEALSTTWRQTLRRCERKVAKMSHRFLVADDQNFDRLFHELCRLHQARWTSPKDQAAFLAMNSVEGWQAYYRFLADLGRSELTKGTPCLFALEIEGHITAIDFLLPWGDSAYLMMRAYDMAYAPLSVGNLLSLWEFQQLYERGIRTIDLGSGHYPYKERLRNGTVETVHIQVVPGLVGALYGLWQLHLKPWIKASRAPQTAPAHLATSLSIG